jgi:hypothetical protein
MNAGAVAQAAEHMPQSMKPLGQIPVPPKKKKRKKSK